MRIFMMMVVLGCAALVAALLFLLRVPSINPPRSELAIARSASDREAITVAASDAAMPQAEIEPAAPAVSQAGSKSPPAETPVRTVRWATDIREAVAAKRVRAAEALLETASPDHEALAAALSSAIAVDDWDTARRLAARAVATAPEDSEARFRYAAVLMRLRHWSTAAGELRECVRISPDRADAWFNLAIAEREAGRLVDARSSWDRCLALRPDSGEALARRGEVLLDLARWADAAADFQAVLKLEPASVEPALNLSLALARLGETESARRLLAPLVESHPRDVRLLNRMAALCAADASIDPTLASRARGLWEQSLMIDAQQAEVREQLELLGNGPGREE